MNSKNKRLSTNARKIKLLVDQVGGQSLAAELLGCSQSLLSRICRGTQEPGQKLMDRVRSADLRNLDIAAGKSNASAHKSNFVRVARELLDGYPEKCGEKLDMTTLPVSSMIYTQTLYAISVDRTRTRQSLLKKMEPSDYLIIETHFELGTIGTDSIVVARRKQNAELEITRHQDLKAAPVVPLDRDPHTGRLYRSIILEGETAETTNKSEPTVEIYGVVLQLVRNLR